MYALEEHMLEIAQVLLEHGADATGNVMVSSFDTVSVNPLHMQACLVATSLCVHITAGLYPLSSCLLTHKLSHSVTSYHAIYGQQA